jgi:hypothetical protein
MPLLEKLQIQQLGMEHVTSTFLGLRHRKAKKMMPGFFIRNLLWTGSTQFTSTF